MINELKTTDLSIISGGTNSKKKDITWQEWTATYISVKACEAVLFRLNLNNNPNTNFMVGGVCFVFARTMGVLIHNTIYHWFDDKDNDEQRPKEEL